MINFITGMLVGMATVGIIIIVVDQLRGRGYSTNPIDIFGGVLLYIWDAMNRSAKKIANIKWSSKREDDYIDEKRIAAEDSVIESYDEDAMYDEAEMDHIDDVVLFCEGKVI